MKLLKSQIEQKTGAGFVTLLPEEPEDMVSATQTDRDRSYACDSV